MYRAEFMFPDGYVLKREYPNDITPKGTRMMEHGGRPIRVDYYGLPSDMHRLVEVSHILLHPISHGGVHFHVE